MRGLFLQGGGAHGAWQAGALEALIAGGLKFDAIMGFSIGAVNGSALAFDRLPEAMSRWRELSGEALRLRPRLSPLSLCSIDPLRDFFAPARDENAAKASLKCDFTVVTACRAENAPINARFTPLARDGWDAPLLDHAVASCAIPLVFPPVDLTYRGRPLRLVDGGVPVRAPLDFSPLAGCDEIVVLEMVRAADLGLRFWTPWQNLDQRCREAARGLVDGGLAPLLKAPKPPLVRRISPSARLEPMMLDFRKKGLAKMLAQGAADAASFLGS